MKKQLTLSLLAILFCMSSLLAQRVQIGTKKSLSITTEHPYSTINQGVVFEKDFYYKDVGYIKLHFQNFDLAEGDYLEIVSKNTDQKVKYTGKGTIDQASASKANGEFWSKSIIDDHVTVRLYSNGVSNNYGFDIKGIALGYTPTEKAKQHKTLSICSENDQKHTICYKDSEPKAYKASRAVCRIVIDEIYSCTGFLLGNEGHVLTNRHCIGNANQATTAEFHFDYEFVDCDEKVRYNNDVVATSSTLLRTDGDLDYALVKLPVNPTTKYGYLSFRKAPVKVGDRIYIPQHPLGYEKTLAIKDDESPTGYGYVTGIGDRVTYQTDTQNGSSGSPVLDYNTNTVVVLHNSGGCSDAVGGNGGNSNDGIIAHLGSLLPNKAVEGNDTSNPPTMPGNLQVSNLTNNSASISWNPSTDDGSITGYQILKGNISLGTTTNTNFDIAGLHANEDYTIKVRAYDNAGNLSKEAIKQVKTKENPTSCPNQSLVSVNLKTDNQSYETVWKITNSSNKVVASGTDYIKNKTYKTSICLPKGEYKFNIIDKYGDGLCCQEGEGSYSVTVNGKEVASGGEFKKEETKDFTVDTGGDGGDNEAPTKIINLVTSNVTSSSFNISWDPSYDNVGIAGYEVLLNGDIAGTTENTNFSFTGLEPSTNYNIAVGAFDEAGNSSPKAFLSVKTQPEDNQCDQTEVIIAVNIDNYGNETDWQLKDANGNVVGSGGNYANNSQNIEKLCLPQGCYSFTITDDYGDGICCSEGEGSYKITVDGKVLAEGGEFEKEETKEVCIGDKPDDTTAPSVPSNFKVVATTSNSISLVWDAATDNVGVAGYELKQNRNALATVTETSYTVSELEPNTEYTFEVVAFDAAGNKSRAAIIRGKTKEKDDTPVQCTSKGRDTSYEWIESVSFGGKTNKSGNNNGYKDFTSTVGNLNIGNNSVDIEVGYNGDSYPENVYVWIDLDNNGLSNEDLVVKGVVDAVSLKEFTVDIPSTVKTGNYTMRVAIKYFDDNNVCGDFDYGEVEDYTVAINNNNNVTIKIYPNPVEETLNISGLKANEGYQILDLSGNLLRTGKGNKANVNSLKSGLYILKTSTKEVKFIKK